MYTSTPQSMQYRSRINMADSVVHRLDPHRSKSIAVQEGFLNWTLVKPKCSKPISRQLIWTLCTPLAMLVVEAHYGCVILLCVPFRISLTLNILYRTLSGPCLPPS